jgi:hypothetical protein
MASEVVLNVGFYFGSFGGHIRENGVIRLVKSVIGDADHIEIRLQQGNDPTKVPLPVTAGAGEQEDHWVMPVPECVKFHLRKTPFLDGSVVDG